LRDGFVIGMTGLGVQFGKGRPISKSIVELENLTVFAVLLDAE